MRFLTRISQKQLDFVEKESIIAVLPQAGVPSTVPCGKEVKRKLDQGVVLDQNTIDADEDNPSKKVRVYTSRSTRIQVPDHVRDEMGKIGLRELRRRGIGQHTIENALRLQGQGEHVQKTFDRD